MNISLKEIKDKLTMLQMTFTPEETAHLKIGAIIEKIEKKEYSSIELYQDLSQIDDKTEMPQFLRDYLYSIMERTKILSNQDKIIKEEIIENENKIEQIIIDLRIRGMFVETLKKEEYKNLNSYKEREEYLEKLKKQNENLTKTSESFKEEKESGKEFSQNFLAAEEDHKELKKVNEDAGKNIKEFTNPSMEQVLFIMDYYREHQNESSMSNIKIEKPSKNPDTRIVEISYKGVEVSEKEPMYRFTFTDIKEFDNNQVYQIITGYNEAGSIEKTIYDQEKKQLDIIGEDESRIEVENLDKIEDVKQYAETMDKQRIKNKPKVRERKIEGTSNIIALTISFMLLTLSTVLIIMIYVKS